MIDSERIKAFWEKRGVESRQEAFESIANLEPNPELLAKKITDESSYIMPRLALTADMRVLDLGAGGGQWSVRMAPFVKEVVAVEYASSMAQIGRETVERMGLGNVTFIESPAEEFCSSGPFDMVLLSGLLIYLSDEQAERLVGNLTHLLATTGRICVRDATSILPERYVIDNHWSEALQTTYSAMYRTRSEYLDLFARHGFTLREDGQVFEEGSVLNKFPETRLRMYVFAKGAGHMA